jgi:hypothetical protein
MTMTSETPLETPVMELDSEVTEMMTTIEMETPVMELDPPTIETPVEAPLMESDSEVTEMMTTIETPLEEETHQDRRCKFAKDDAGNDSRITRELNAECKTT